MVVLIKALQLILSLSLLVIVHEFGHFIFAKLFKCRVEKFYLFFNPWFALFKKKVGETEYGIGWLPLGGYVKIAGMIDESMDKEQMKKPAQEWEFRAKPAWQRLFIMIGGVLFNFILAIIIYSAVLFTWGEQYLPAKNVKHGIVASELGQKMGLQTGDYVLAIDGNEIEDFSKIIPTILLDQAKTIQVERDGEKVTLPISSDIFAEMIKAQQPMIAPRIPFVMKVVAFAKESAARDAGMEIGDEVIGLNNKDFDYYDEFTAELQKSKNSTVEASVLRGSDTLKYSLRIGKSGMMGVSYDYNAASDLEFATKEYGLAASIPAGIDKGISTSKNYLKQFKLMFKPETKAYESLGGFISIGKIFPGTWNWYAFWNMSAFLSIILAIMNILPIPALDGGHVMMVFWEIITRRKPSEKFLEYAQTVGMILLLALVLMANLNDVIRLFAN